MHLVDLRSDTVTRPTPSMRRAMAEAEVGDDVFGEDPTIIKLEELAAERLGKEAAIFVASGTMGNMVSVLAQCGRGDEVILGDQCHAFFYEQGGMSALGGIHPRTIRNQPNGTMDILEIEAAIRPDNVHFPRTRLISLENTHNRCHGSPLTLGYTQAVARVARQYGVKLHIDGARIFNSAVAQGVKARDLVADADTVTFCLSKGLAAPVGSVVCGTRDFIAEARRVRKSLGGGMRQAGILAAAGIVALKEMVERLADDHANASRLAHGLAEIEGLVMAPEYVTTNIVYIGVDRGDLTADALEAKLRAEGILVLSSGSRQLRAVLNYHVSTDDVDRCLKVFREILM